MTAYSKGNLEKPCPGGKGFLQSKPRLETQARSHSFHLPVLARHLTVLCCCETEELFSLPVLLSPSLICLPADP